MEEKKAYKSFYTFFLHRAKSKISQNIKNFSLLLYFSFGVFVFHEEYASAVGTRERFSMQGKK